MSKVCTMQYIVLLQIDERQNSRMNIFGGNRSENNYGIIGNSGK